MNELKLRNIKEVLKKSTHNTEFDYEFLSRLLDTEGIINVSESDKLKALNELIDTEIKRNV